MHPFRAAIEARDLDALNSVMAEDVRFLSPVSFPPYEGRVLVAAILRGVERVFEDFRYVREIGDEHGTDLVLEFKARIGDREVHGADYLRLNDEGKITELCVMLRPLSAVQTMAERMAVQFEQVKREVTEAMAAAESAA